MIFPTVGSLSEAAKNLCITIMQDEKGSVWTIPRPLEKERLVVNGSDYITDQDPQETRREKWAAFDELEQRGILFKKSLHATNGSIEYKINRALARNIR